MDFAAVEAVLGSAIARRRRLAGGDINEAFAAELTDGREVFVKTNRRDTPGMFPAEARGLRWLADARAVRVPEVLAADDAFLVLELVKPGRPAASFDEDFGRSLAALHRTGAPEFGLDHDNFIGRLPQSNQPSPSWTEFYRSQRLEPQLKQAVDQGLVPPAFKRGFGRLFARLEELVGREEPPARLHGDLWGGNLMCDEHGAPCLVDPAVYGGHREVDLAMMQLFGGFGPRVFAAYEEAFPLAPGHRERVPLYQLYPLLVHVNLFGGAYVSRVAAELERLV